MIWRIFFFISRLPTTTKVHGCVCAPLGDVPLFIQRQEQTHTKVVVDREEKKEACKFIQPPVLIMFSMTARGTLSRLMLRTDLRKFIIE